MEVFARDPFVSRPGYTLIAAGWFCRVEVFHFNAFEVPTYVISTVSNGYSFFL